MCLAEWMDGWVDGLISPHLPRFQVRPSKSRLFRSQSIDSERKQTPEHSEHKYSVMWKTLSSGEILFRIESHFFASEE